MKIWTDERTLDLGECPTVKDMVEALRFKARFIRAKADPVLFEHAADMLIGFVGMEDLVYERMDWKPVAHARWIVKMDCLGREYTECSNCKTMFKSRSPNGSFELLDLRGFKYCPNCGAKMDLKEE